MEFNVIIFRTLGIEYHTVIASLSLKPEPSTIQELYGPHKPTATMANQTNKVSNDHPVHNFKSDN